MLMSDSKIEKRNINTTKKESYFSSCLALCNFPELEETLYPNDKNLA